MNCDGMVDADDFLDFMIEWKATHEKHNTIIYNTPNISMHDLCIRV